MRGWAWSSAAASKSARPSKSGRRDAFSRTGKSLRPPGSRDSRDPRRRWAFARWRKIFSAPPGTDGPWKAPRRRTEDRPGRKARRSSRGRFPARLRGRRSSAAGNSAGGWRSCGRFSPICRAGSCCGGRRRRSYQIFLCCSFFSLLFLLP